MTPSKLRKQSKRPISKLKREAWKLFSAFIRKRDKNICFTCGAVTYGSSYHAGHMIPRLICGPILYFSEEAVRGQCFRCNINLGGNGAVFAFNYEKRYGKEKYLRLMRLWRETRGTKWTEAYLLEIIKKYA